MIDQQAAASLRKLFAQKAGQYPYLLPEAEIIFENSAETQFKIKAKSPQDAAQILQHLYNHDGAGIFDRMGEWDNDKPLYFRMHKRVRLGADDKEHCMMAFNFTFRGLDKPSHLWISDPETNDYYWQGDEKIENKSPMTYEGPTLMDLITILQKAGENWQDVNFITPRKNPPLKLVHSKP